jgi:hypothetical protein
MAIRRQNFCRLIAILGSEATKLLSPNSCDFYVKIEIPAILITGPASRRGGRARLTLPYPYATTREGVRYFYGVRYLFRRVRYYSRGVRYYCCRVCYYYRRVRYYSRGVRYYCCRVRYYYRRVRYYSRGVRYYYRELPLLSPRCAFILPRKALLLLQNALLLPQSTLLSPRSALLLP